MEIKRKEKHRKKMRKKFGVLPAFGSQFLCEKE
jgi:hypothetical protein